jgi:ketosteroid isomerase-like protein
MRIMIFLLTLVALSCSRAPRETTLQEAEVLAVIASFDKGWQEKNAALVDSVLSEHYVYFTQSGNAFDRSGLIATAGSDIYTLQSMERESQTMQIEGNTAVVNTVWKGKGIYHGEVFNDRQRCSITIIKHEGKVKILAEHCTPIKGDEMK